MRIAIGFASPRPNLLKTWPSSRCLRSCRMRLRGGMAVRAVSSLGEMLSGYRIPSAKRSIRSVGGIQLVLSGALLSAMSSSVEATRQPRAGAALQSFLALMTSPTLALSSANLVRQRWAASGLLQTRATLSSKARAAGRRNRAPELVSKTSVDPVSCLNESAGVLVEVHHNR
jgi:hypothetical protein